MKPSEQGLSAFFPHSVLSYSDNPLASKDDATDTDGAILSIDDAIDTDGVNDSEAIRVEVLVDDSIEDACLSNSFTRFASFLILYFL